MTQQRTYDVVLFGATGFTGGLTAEYLAMHAPEGMRWALAGRSRDRLEAVRSRLVGLGASMDGLDLIEADAGDAAALRRLAASTRVVVSTVGPYLAHGEPLVAACADAGTDYADLTGEPEFVDRMYLAHHARAVETGARLVHACGFDSVPHDLGALFTVLQLPEGVPLRLRGMVRASGTFSGGTFHSAMGAFSRAKEMRAALRERRAVEPRPEGRRARAAAQRPHRDPDSGMWLLPLPTIDPTVVARSAAASQRYGPDFEYAHYAAFRRLPMATAAAVAAGGLGVTAQVRPLRELVLRRVPAGTGPSEERRERSRFSVRFAGEGGGRTVRTEVAGGDPGYTETAKMLGESALCLAFDDLPPAAGQVTPATAMGETLIDRLVAAGLTFRVLDD